MSSPLFRQLKLATNAEREVNQVNPTLELLRFIGSPFAYETYQVKYNNLELYELHQLARRNRMRFQFLEALKKKGDLGDFAALYIKERNKCLENIEAICNVSKILTDSSVSHAIFKTLRPYKSPTVDIDTLIFGKEVEHLRATQSLLNAGYRMVVIGPRSTTLLDPKSNMGVDLYGQVAVSYLIYMEKEKLINFITTIDLSNGSVKILKPEADLGAIIAHSVIKEQMYTLSEYYTFLHYLNSLDIDNFLDILKQNNLTSVAVTHATITALLHQLAHGTVPCRLQQILEGLGEKTYETDLLLQNNIKTPHKYHMLTVTRSLLEIMKGKKCRDSLAMQILHVLNPYFSEKLLKDLLMHITRKTY